MTASTSGKLILSPGLTALHKALQTALTQWLQHALITRSRSAAAGVELIAIWLVLMDSWEELVCLHHLTAERFLCG